MEVLPYDMLVQIFQRLPVKSVCRLKAVSSYMKKVIEDSDSVKRSRPAIFTRLVVFHDWKILSFFTLERNGITRRKFKTEELINDLKIANGLVFFRIDAVDGEMRILNTCLGKSILIQCSLGRFFEFGYNSLRKTYNFLKWDEKFNFQVADLPYLKENCNCSWRMVKNDENVRFFPTKCMSLDYRLVWFCSGDSRLTVFSLEDESFSHVLLPPTVSPDEKVLLMFEIDGKISISARQSNELWILKPNGWLKVILSFEFPRNLYSVYSEQGEIMVIEFKSGLKVVLGHYSFVTGTLCYTEITGDMEDIDVNINVEGFAKNDIDLCEFNDE